MTVIRFKATRIRKDPAPRTCCPSHNDRCRFGRPHIWSAPFYDATGVWRDDGAYLCDCGAICEADV
jgi:hypothetical protein